VCIERGSCERGINARRVRGLEFVDHLL